MVACNGNTGIAALDIRGRDRNDNLLEAVSAPIQQTSTKNVAVDVRVTAEGCENLTRDAFTARA